MAVQVRVLAPSPPAAMKVMVEVVCQMPCGVEVCVTSLLRLGTLHENTGGCDGHVCVTEHETYSGAALEMVNHIAWGIVVDDIPSFFGPDATRDRLILLVQEAAGNHHTGASQGAESERDFSIHNMERCRGREQQAMMGCLGYVFRAQTQEIKERGGNQSTGIDFFITQERVIFLDTQPMLSPSILGHLINNDRKLPPEYNLPPTLCIICQQSLQIAAFLFTVCHVVIVVQDWFTDLNLYRFLQTAEMLKPSTPSASHDSAGSSGNDDGAEYYPHIVFLQNKARRDDFCPRNLKNMYMVVDKLMAHSHLKYKGTLSMLDCNMFPGLEQDYLATEVNMFLLPMQENDGEDNLTEAGTGTYPLFSLLPGYRGHPAFSTMVSKLRSQILAMPRCQLSHTILTEKNWFHYAARIWDGVKKSSALSEYSRLLC
ncbi:nonsense-mediated mRNA decay factor SMG9-like [Lycodopsis pacificus]